MIKALFTEKQPLYRYMPIDDVYADVFIYSYVDEVHVGFDDIKQIQYMYDFNHFRVKKTEITEQTIANNPLKYLNYKKVDETNEEKIKTLEERQSLTEQAVQDLILYTLEG